jgi:hypothetical protein
MELGDAGDVLGAEAEQARRAPQEPEQEETRAMDAAPEHDLLPGPLLFCPYCNAAWAAEAVREPSLHAPRCLLCGGPLTEAPPE